MSVSFSALTAMSCTRFGGAYTEIGTKQRRLAWPLRKDDTQNREAFHIFKFRVSSTWEISLATLTIITNA